MLLSAALKKLCSGTKSVRQKTFRGHTDLNHGPIGLQPIALPLSYIPKLNNSFKIFAFGAMTIFICRDKPDTLLTSLNTLAYLVILWVMHYCDLNFHPKFHGLLILQVGSSYFFALHHNGKMAMYKLRHSFASNSISNATPPALIQRNLMYKKLIEAMLGASIGNMYIDSTDHF